MPALACWSCAQKIKQDKWADNNEWQIKQPSIDLDLNNWKTGTKDTIGQTIKDLTDQHNGETLYYHYTDIKSFELIQNSGLRASTTGMGAIDGGLYFMNKGPDHYGFEAKTSDEAKFKRFVHNLTGDALGNGVLSDRIDAEYGDKKILVEQWMQVCIVAEVSPLLVTPVANRPHACFIPHKLLKLFAATETSSIVDDHGHPFLHILRNDDGKEIVNVADN